MVAAEAQGVAKEADIKTDHDDVHYVGYKSLDSLLLAARKRLRSKAKKVKETKQKVNRSTGFLVKQIRAFFAWPDDQAGWIRPAVKVAMNISENWQPDVIVSSALPFAGHCVASRVQRNLEVPWVADYRDLFSGNPYNKLPKWRDYINRLWEKKVLSQVTQLTTVSKPLAEDLKALHSKPTSVILSGYDSSVAKRFDIKAGNRSKPIRILYSGIIYPGKRDPEPLFEAIKNMGLGPDQINISFYGQDLRGIEDTAVKHGVQSCVNVNPAVSREEVLKLQAEADILLLLLWDDPREVGVYTGKLFEYLAARRPFLCIGCKDGVAASMIRERKLGVSVNDSLEIEQALKNWIHEFNVNKRIAPPDEESREGLRREDQFNKFENIIQRVGDLRK